MEANLAWSPRSRQQSLGTYILRFLKLTSPDDAPRLGMKTTCDLQDKFAIKARNHLSPDVLLEALLSCMLAIIVSDIDTTLNKPVLTKAVNKPQNRCGGASSSPRYHLVMLVLLSFDGSY